MKLILYEQKYYGAITQEFLIFVNNIYSLVMAQYSNGTIFTDVIYTKELDKYHIYLFDYKELNEIETLILDINSKICKYKESLEKTLSTKNIIQNYTKEIMEIKDYIEMLEQNSACGNLRRNNEMDNL